MSNLERERVHYTQTRASEVELDRLKEITGQKNKEDAIREAILRTIKGA